MASGISRGWLVSLSPFISSALPQPEEATALIPCSVPNTSYRVFRLFGWNLMNRLSSQMCVLCRCKDPRLRRSFI